MFNNPHHTLILVQHVEDEPDVLAPSVLYVAHWDAPEFWTPDNPPACAVLLCPCGCGESVYVSLMTGDRPNWKLTGDEGQPATLTPSIQHLKGCKSHYWLTEGRIVWAGTPVQIGGES